MGAGDSVTDTGEGLAVTVWFLLAVLVLTPIAWALLGTPGSTAVAGWMGDVAPSLVPPATVEPPALLAAALIGTVLGAGRGRLASTHVSTVAHEFGHGLTAAALGGRITRLRMERDGSGVAHTAMPAGRPVRSFAVAAAGYLAPGVLALASMQATAPPLATLWLAYLVAVVAVMLVLAVRSWWGVLLAVMLGAGGWAVVVLAPAPFALVAVAGLAGVLGGGGVADALGQWRTRSSASTSDARAMARQTGLPAWLFAGVHLVAALGLAGAALTQPLWG